MTGRGNNRCMTDLRDRDETHGPSSLPTMPQQRRGGNGDHGRPALDPDHPALYDPAMLERTGSAVRHAAADLLDGLGFGVRLHGEALSLLRRGRLALPVLTAQLYFTGVEALPIVALIALAIGAAVIIQGVSLLPQFGQGELAYRILILVITRELGPLLTALIVAARSGSAITTELGNMVVDHEIDAYTAAGIDPVAFLAAPRLLGVTGAVVLLNLFFNVFGLFGSCAVASLIHRIPLSTYLGSVVLAMGTADVLSSLIKSVLFGVIVATTATWYGLRVERAVTEVPQKTIKSLGVSMALCMVASTAVTLLLQAV